MMNCYDSYILRISWKMETGLVEGNVEIVGGRESAKPFRNMEELWEIVGKAPAEEKSPE